MRAGKDRETSERRELEILPKALALLERHRCEVAIDGGANVGRWSLELAKHFRAVLAFEPVDDTFRALRERTDENHRIYAFRFALFDRLGRVQMTHPPKRSSSTAYFAKRLTPQDDVPSPSISYTIDELRLEDCDLIKLDLEGAELRALQGARKTLARFHPLLIVECVDRQLRRFDDSRAALERFLLDQGYRLALSQEPNRVYWWQP